MEDTMNIGNSNQQAMTFARFWRCETSLHIISNSLEENKLTVLSK